MREVTKDEFFRAVGQLDVHPYPVGRFPYTSIWKTRAGVEWGRSVDAEVNGALETRYYLVR